MELNTVPGGVCAPVGFKACGIAAGLKPDRPDLALIVSDVPCEAAACFTTNTACAAPILVSREHLAAAGQARAVVINSGYANACTGDQGIEHARETCVRLASLLKVPTEQVLVASTGVIGVPLPVDKILNALPEAVNSLSREGASAAMRAIMTTDTRPKERSYEIQGDLRCRLGGMAKGAGMIAPNMATMLSVITSDVSASSACLQGLLREAVEGSFNAVTVDGDTSTNDTVFLLANGQSGAPRLDDHDELREIFAQALLQLCQDLAKMIAQDGEGATKLVTVHVIRALTRQEARQVAKTVAESMLVKTALYGGDPNWGRIVAAVGRTGLPLDPSRMKISLSGSLWLDEGYQEKMTEAEANARLKKTECELVLDLGRGVATDTVWTCDLTEGYVAINAHYRT